MISLANSLASKVLCFPVNTCSTEVSHRSPFVLSVSNDTKRKFTQIKSASTALVNYNSPSIVESFRFDEKPAEARTDDWMERTVTDIVKNLNQAPLLVHVCREIDHQGNSKFEFKTEKAMQENWPIVTSKWRSGQTRSPDGLIFVEELVEDHGSSNEGEKLEDGSEAVDGMTRAWGILAQWKGVKSRQSCYLLKTTRVEAGYGLGLFSTHFSLTKVRNFRESALTQLQDFWLLQ